MTPKYWRSPIKRFRYLDYFFDWVEQAWKHDATIVRWSKQMRPK